MEGSDGAAATGMERDRLSDLPDSLLHCILSHLGSRQVVQTYLLSQRWRDLWRGASAIDLDDREFLSTAAPGNGGDAALYDRFEDFADNLLLRRAASSASPPLDTLRICIGKDTRHRNPTRWVRRGLRFSPSALDVRCRTGSFGVDLAAAAPRLTRLRLENVSLMNTFMDQLDTLFPALEELHLKGCSFSMAQIASATLKHLAVDHCRQRFDNQRVVPIVAPHLATLRLAIPLYSGVPGGHATFTGYSVRGAPPSLARASVIVMDTGGYLNALPTVQYSLTGVKDPRSVQNMAFLDSQRELLGSLSAVSFLELSGFRPMVRRPSSGSSLVLGQANPDNNPS